MPRLMGVDIPPNKPTHISLRYLVGIGPTTARELCVKAHVDPQRKARELSDEDLARIAGILDKDDSYTVEGALKRQGVVDGTILDLPVLRLAQSPGAQGMPRLDERRRPEE